MSSAPTRHDRALPRVGISALLALMVVAAVSVPTTLVRGETAPDHLVISEVVTGAGSASDELIEVYNPTAVALPLEGLELVYVTATGATISRRAIWELGAASVGAGRHVLVANELGVPTGLAFGSDGSLYVGDRSGSVFRVSATRQVETFASLPASVDAVYGSQKS